MILDEDPLFMDTIKDVVHAGLTTERTERSDHSCSAKWFDLSSDSIVN